MSVFSCSTRFNPQNGEMIHFDENDFQLGWLKPPTSRSKKKKSHCESESNAQGVGKNKRVPSLVRFLDTIVDTHDTYMNVSENRGNPKSSILIGCSIITIHFGVPLFMETAIYIYSRL